MATLNKNVMLFTLISIVRNVITYEAYCTSQPNSCPNPIRCPSDELCIINCFGSPNSTCTKNHIYCTDGYPCTVNCIHDQSCLHLTLFCPDNAPCDAIAPYSTSPAAMYRSTINGGYNGTLNVRIDVDIGMEGSHITCPINGECNIYSANTNKDEFISEIFAFADINATLSNTLNISIRGYKDPLLRTFIDCPMSSFSNQAAPNCVIHISDGGDATVTRLLATTRIVTNEYTNLYLQTSAIACKQCSAILALHCADKLRYTCVMQLVDGTDDEWHCNNKSRQTQCPTIHPTTAIPTTTTSTTSKSTTDKSTTSTSTTTKIISTTMMEYSTTQTIITQVRIMDTAINTTAQHIETSDITEDDGESWWLFANLSMSLLITVLIGTVLCLFVCIICCFIVVSAKKRERPHAGEKSTTESTNLIHGAAALPGVDIVGNLNLENIEIPLKTMRQNSQMEGVHKKGVLCVKCCTLIHNGKMSVQNGKFYCHRCKVDVKENEDQIEIIELTECNEESNNSHSISDMYGSINTKQTKNTFQQKQYGHCQECDRMALGKIYDEDQSFYCMDCWKYYEEHEDVYNFSGKRSQSRDKKSMTTTTNPDDLVGVR